MSSPEAQTTRLVCIGAIMYSDGKVFHRYCEPRRVDHVLMGTPQGHTVDLSKPLSAGPRGSDVPGCIYEGKAWPDETGELATFAVGSGREGGQVDDDEVWDQIKAEASANASVINLRKEEKKLRKHDAVKERVRPLKDAYDSCPGWAAKQALINRVVSLMSGSR